MKRILIFFGGCSTEYGVSLQSAQGILTALDTGRYVPLAVGITREGRWLYYTGSFENLGEDHWQEGPCIPCTLSLDRGTRQLLLLDGSGRTLHFDAALPVLHGKNGEDGTLQGLLELAGVPVIGCGCLASALCMDKDRAHKLAALAGVDVPRGRIFRQGTPMRELLAAAKALGLPLFVKPVRAGSSFGITRVTAFNQFEEAVQLAFANDREILLEEAVDGFEVGCAILGTETLTTGLVDEIELSQGFFDFEEKYTLKTSTIHCPARIAPEQALKIQEAAKIIYRALGCSGFARVDLFLTPEGRILFNEVNTIPGFTPHSRYPHMMEGIGLTFPELVRRLLETEVTL